MSATAGGVLQVLREALAFAREVASDEQLAEAHQALSTVEAMAVALEEAKDKLHEMADDFADSRFSDRHGDGPAMRAIANKAARVLDAFGSAAPAGGGGELPELPACKWLAALPRGYESFPYYTAEQMHEYGQQCRLASTQAAGGGGEFATLVDDVTNAAWTAARRTIGTPGERKRFMRMGIEAALSGRLASIGSVPAPSGVPRELTQDMNEAGEREIAFGNDFQDAWRAAVAAAPTQEQQALKETGNAYRRRHCRN